jgi:hypothetical protein
MAQHESGSAHSGNDRPRGPRRPPFRLARPAAIALTVPAAVVDTVAALTIGEGVSLPASVQEISIPMMGEVQVELAVTVIGASADPRAEDGGRLRLTVDGLVSVAFKGDTPIPSPPRPVHVRLCALVPLVGTLTGDEAQVGLDMGNAEFVSAQVIPDPEAGFDPFAQVGDLLFGQIGPGLFGGLAANAGVIGDTISGIDFASLGVGQGSLEILVGDGVLGIGIPQHEALVRAHEQTAHVLSPEGNSVGVSIAGPAIGPVLSWSAKRALGGTPLPFEIESKVGSKGLSARVRSARILPAGLPDVRPGLRSTLSLHHRGDHLLFIIDEAWVTSPLLPRRVNRLNRQLGTLATSMAPRSATRTRIPSIIPVPVPGSDDPYPLTITSLQLAEGRVDLRLDVGL